MIKEKQEELKEWLKKSGITNKAFAERVFYHLYDNDNPDEIQKFQEKFKKDITRGKNTKLIETYLEILYEQPEFLKLGHTKTIFLYDNIFDDEVNQKLKIIYHLLDKFIVQAKHIIDQNDVDYDDIVLDVLFENTKKSFIIFQEIVCLIQSQFFSGAYGRWRSLHELLVISLFIKKHGKECAIDYIKSISLQQKHAFDIYLEHQGKFPESERFTNDEKEHIEELFNDIEDSKDSYKWSSNCLQKHSFANIEKDIGFEHLRTFYKMSSMLLHGNITFPPESIGLAISHPIITFYDMVHTFILKQIEVIEDKKDDNDKEKIIDKIKPLNELKSNRDIIQKLINDLIGELIKNHK